MMLTLKTLNKQNTSRETVFLYFLQDQDPSRPHISQQSALKNLFLSHSIESNQVPGTVGKRTTIYDCDRLIRKAAAHQPKNINTVASHEKTKIH